MLHRKGEQKEKLTAIFSPLILRVYRAVIAYSAQARFDLQITEDLRGSNHHRVDMYPKILYNLQWHGTIPWGKLKYTACLTIIRFRSSKVEHPSCNRNVGVQITTEAPDVG